VSGTALRHVVRPFGRVARHGVATCGETVRTRGCGQSREHGCRQAAGAPRDRYVPLADVGTTHSGPALGRLRGPTGPEGNARRAAGAEMGPARGLRRRSAPRAGGGRRPGGRLSRTGPRAARFPLCPAATEGSSRSAHSLTITRWPFRLSGFPYGCGPRPRSRTGALVALADLRSPLQLLGELVPDLRVVARELNDQFDAVRGH
jgi:hypothetical protein